MNCPRCNAPAEEQTLREFGGVCPKCLLAFSEEKDAPAFPNLEIVEMIGQGGMGVVYKARQKNLDRLVALKVLSPQLSDDPEFVERFTREARALAQLSHPNIVAIYDSGIHDRVPYLVMEYVEGKSLRRMLGEKALTAEQALGVVPQICDALQYAHARGVVHRDIKPENILIDAGGRVRIADYGLAKIASIDQPRITRSNVAMGTPHYMAPEQIERGTEVDHRADIYSLGVVFYEMLTGELPLGRFKPPSEKAEVDRRLDPVVMKSLEKEPIDRYQSADALKAQIARLDQPPPRPAPAPEPRTSRMAVASGIAALGSLTCLTLAIIFASNGQYAAAKVFVPMAAALLLLTSAFSVAALVLIRRSRGALEGRWIAVSSLVFSSLSTIVALLGLVSGAAPAPPAAPRAIAVRRPSGESDRPLDDFWPQPEDLPAGIRMDGTVEGRAVFEPANRAIDDDDSVPATPDPAFFADLKTARRSTFSDGRVELIGYEFKTVFARKRWEKEYSLRSVTPWVYAAESRTTILLRMTGTRRDAVASATLDLLYPLVRKRLK